MLRLVARSAVVVGVVMVLAACGEGTESTPTAGDDQQAASPSPTVVDDAVPEEDLSLAGDFVVFAARPSNEAAARLPFDDQVGLGLGRDLMTTLKRAESADASAWRLDAKSFRAYTGTFSALESIRRHAAETGSTSVRPDGGGPFQVSVGDHPHCASPPVPAPGGFERHRRVSVQPSESSIDSCLSWFSVDLFLTDQGRIAAVTLDIWEP